MTSTLLQDLAALERQVKGTAWQVPRLQACRMALHTERVNDAAAVARALKDFDPQAGGWVETSDRAVHWRSGQPWPAGAVLNAELAAGARSLHVREADDSWLCTSFDEAPPKGCAGVLEGWVVERRLLGQVDPARYWRYRVLIQPADDGELREVAARLVPDDDGNGWGEGPARQDLGESPT